MKRGAFFLDRDGTINIDRVYINDARLIELLPGAAHAIGRVRRLGYKVVVVTNQSGIGRGIIPPGELPRIHDRMEVLLHAEDEDAAIDRYEICVHRPEENCECRKPSPKMVREAAEHMDIDLGCSVFVGDKLTDVAAGRRAGCRFSILLRSGKGEGEEKLLTLDPALLAEQRPDHVAEDLAEAVSWSLARLEPAQKI